MRIIEFIKQVSFKKLTALTFILALSLTVPISVWVVQQETKVTGRAFFEKPEPMAPEKKYGQPSATPPQITLVWPFLGKPGDVVLIHGENFGDNPKDKTLILGEQVILEKNIVRWTPNLVEFQIPQMPSGGYLKALSLSVAGNEDIWDYPFTVYDLQTTIQVKKDDRYLQVLNPLQDVKIEVYFQDGEKISVPIPGAGGVFLREEKPILSVIVRDINNQLISFFVEPSEFNF